MDKSITAAEANRRFSALLRGVRGGQSYVVTSHGRPVARLAPAAGSAAIALAARDILLDRLKGQEIVRAERWTRDELYDNDP